MESKKLHFGAMKSEKLFLTFHQTMHKADAAFYQGYDPQFLAKKAALLYGIYKNIGEFQKCSEGWDVRANAENMDVLSVIATELHNATFHQTEALIAFLLCEFQDRPDWVYLTTYGNAEMKNAAKAIIAGDFEKLTNGAFKDAEGFVKSSVYANIDFSRMDVAERWARSVADIAWLIQHVAERFVAGHEYNAYKHGLRVSSGSAGFGVMNGPSFSDVLPVLSMKHSVTHLELGEAREGYVGQCVTKEVSPEYSFELIQGMAIVLFTAKEMRIARTKRSVESAHFAEFDRDLLLRKQPYSTFSFPY